ncbi:hypothetical protein KXS11_05970 [Plantibacter flavus]|uniref:hypothetical protein n=1 Tax=Plantibacter flavus TaxID=150123 RepID=UPI003F15CEC2
MSDTATDLNRLLDETWVFESGDELFTDPYIDIDEPRTLPSPHRYVHGGFRGTDTRFSLYLPEAGAYQGRFFQHVTPFPQSEHLAQLAPAEHNKITFANSSGAYFVETNGGGALAGDPTGGVDPTIAAYRANAAVARFSRLVANRIFGPGRVYGYLYGGSGGGYRSIGAAENTEGAWDGYVPHVIGSDMAIPNVFCIRMHAMRVLESRLPDIVDAYDVGGDPSSLQLDEEQRAALDEVTRMGFPLRSWFGWRTMGLHGFSALYPGVMMTDPGYADDFWTVSGYLGADPTASIHQARVQLSTSVVEVISTAVEQASGGVDESFKHIASSDATHVTALRLAEAPTNWIIGAQLEVRSGAEAGSVLRLAGVEGDVAVLEGWGQEDAARGIAVGDEVVLDNSNFLAVQTYHRHQVPGPEYHVWDQFRASDGTPRFPQRPFIIGPLMSKGATGTEITGRIHGKMIVAASLLDREAFPWQADWYRRKVAEHLGARTDEHFRLWYTDNALHGDEDPQEFPARSVSYIGVLETALRQLAAWVEDGVEPSASSNYDVIDGQVVIPTTVTERGGVQPTVSLTVDGGPVARVRVGDQVRVDIEAEAACDGVIVELVELLTAVDGTESVGSAFDITAAPSVALVTTRTFSTPGTHFLAVRVTAQTAGATDDPHATVQNLSRARVIVTPTAS